MTSTIEVRENTGHYGTATFATWVFQLLQVAKVLVLESMSLFKSSWTNEKESEMIKGLVRGLVAV